MIALQHEAWGHSILDLEEAAANAVHPRTRMRFLLLLAVARGVSPTKAARERGLRPETGIKWVRWYNQGGLAAVQFVQTGGRRPLFRPSC